MKGQTNTEMSGRCTEGSMEDEDYDMATEGSQLGRMGALH
jgi:hypothetical protein